MDAGEAIVESVRRTLESDYGPVRTVEGPDTIGTGFDSTILLVRFEGLELPVPLTGPLVVRAKSDADRDDEARREAAIQDWVADRGFPAPRVLRVFPAGAVAPGPVQLVERAPGVDGLARTRSAPWRARRGIDRLAETQTRLHRLDPEGFPDREDLLDRRLRLVRTVDDAVGDQRVRRGLEQVLSSAPELRRGDPAVCHGDYHPLNVLVTDDGVPSVVDWTDAGVGDRHGDLARTLVLFDVAAIAATGCVERVVLGLIGPRLGRWYRRSYEARLPVDELRLRLWAPVHLLHALAQAVGMEQGAFPVDGPADRRAGHVPPGLVGDLTARLEMALAALR